MKTPIDSPRNFGQVNVPHVVVPFTEVTKMNEKQTLANAEQAFPVGSRLGAWPSAAADAKGSIFLIMPNRYEIPMYMAGDRPVLALIGDDTGPYGSFGPNRFDLPSLKALIGRMHYIVFNSSEGQPEFYLLPAYKMAQGKSAAMVEINATLRIEMEWLEFYASYRSSACRCLYIGPNTQKFTERATELGIEMVSK